MCMHGFFISICEHTYTQVCTWVCVHVYIWQCYVAMCRQIHAWVWAHTLACSVTYEVSTNHLTCFLSLPSDCQAGSPPAWGYSYPDSPVQWGTEGWRFSEDWEDLNHSFLVFPLFLSLLLSYHSRVHLGTEKMTWRLVKRDSSICLASRAARSLGYSISLLALASGR